jgi:hypothetical protein
MTIINSTRALFQLTKYIVTKKSKMCIKVAPPLSRRENEAGSGHEGKTSLAHFKSYL